MTINNKSERNYRGKCLGSPVTSYGGEYSMERMYVMVIAQRLFSAQISATKSAGCVVGIAMCKTPLEYLFSEKKLSKKHTNKMRVSTKDF